MLDEKTTDQFVAQYDDNTEHLIPESGATLQQGKELFFILGLNCRISL
jgi:hypothetical protein